MKPLSFSKILIILSVLLLIGTGYLIVTQGKLVYFLAFHKPFSLPGFASSLPSARVHLPSFTLHSSISSQSLTGGESQIIKVTVLAHQNVTAFLKVWITAPSSKEVYKSPLPDKPIDFAAGAPRTFQYTYQLPSHLSSGVYKVSDLLTSPNMQTDYYVDEDFTEFKVL